jgi:hypothetical protein
MRQLVERASDRLLGMVVPKVKAKADLCSCSGSQVIWGAYCYCGGNYSYYRKQVCNGCHYGASYCARRFAGCP